MGIPNVVIHADWSIHPKKRWMAKATRQGDRWLLEGPWKVPPSEKWVETLLEAAADGGSLAVGFDFPIGVPAAYAERAGIPSFPWLLDQLETPEWVEFLHVCNVKSEISVQRPFYPHAPGGTKRDHVLNGLGLESNGDLLRRCDRAQVHRTAASPLFWTLGAKQVGKAAITGWREVVVPLRRLGGDAVGLWPFEGSFTDLHDAHRIVIAETYPGEVYHRLGFPLGGPGKRDQAKRRLRGVEVHKWMEDQPITLDPELEHRLIDGFGPEGDGEDPFDAVVGLVGMVGTILRGDADPPTLDDDPGRAVEGWIFGQDPATEKAAS